MNIISEILQTIGLPTIIGFVIWLVRVETQTKQTKEKIDILWKETERLEAKFDAFVVSTNERFEMSKNAMEKKLADTLDRLTDSIQILTHATTKHDLQMENMQQVIHELKDNFHTRHSISINNEGVR